MDRLEIVHLIEKSVAKETLEFPNIQLELEGILNYLKLLFLGEQNIAKELKWPEWAIDKGGQEREWFRKALYRAFNGQCFWTGKLLDYSNMEIDHVIPKAKGGPDNFLNYVPCEKKRNREKWDSLKRNLKLITTLYYIETVFGDKLEGQIRQFREEKRKARQRKEKIRNELLQIDEVNTEDRSKLFLIFWGNFEEKLEERLESKGAQDKLQAFFQVLGPVLSKNGIRKKLWEQFNLEIANCGRQSWYKIINEKGFETKNKDYRQAIVNALRKMGIRGGRERVSYDEIKQMDILLTKTYLSLTHFDKVVQDKIYQNPNFCDEKLDKELARVMNRLAENLECASSF